MRSYKVGSMHEIMRVTVEARHLKTRYFSAKCAVSYAITNLKPGIEIRHLQKGARSIGVPWIIHHTRCFARCRVVRENSSESVNNNVGTVHDIPRANVHPWPRDLCEVHGSRCPESRLPRVLPHRIWLRHVESTYWKISCSPCCWAHPSRRLCTTCRGRISRKQRASSTPACRLLWVAKE